MGIKSFLQAEQLKANAAEAVYYIDVSFFLLGYYNSEDKLCDRAAQHFETALKLNPCFEKAELMLGVIKIRL